MRAVPVTDFTGQVIGALGISGPIWRFQIRRCKVGEDFQAAANRLSTEFGTAKAPQNSIPNDEPDLHAFCIDSRRWLQKISCSNKKSSLTFSHRWN